MENLRSVGFTPERPINGEGLTKTTNLSNDSNGREVLGQFLLCTTAQLRNLPQGHRDDEFLLWGSGGVSQP
jgi:hypothetical protein